LSVKPGVAVGRLGTLTLLAVALAPACTQGEGTGSVCGSLDVPDCWAGPFNLHPNFFAAVPTQPQDSLQIRIQNGGDYETFSDGVAILIDDAGEIRGDPTSSGVPRPSLLGQTLVVGLPAGVTAPGVPLEPVTNPTIVHASLYLDKTCRIQNDALYAVAAVTLNPDGTCLSPDGGEPEITCPGPAIASIDGGTETSLAASDASVAADATLAAADASAATSAGDASLAADASLSVPDANAPPAVVSASAGAAEAGASFDSDVAACPADPEAVTDGASGALVQVPGTSTIVFSSLFDGNEDETNAEERLTDAQFDFYFADPREVCPGGVGPPPPCRGHMVGYFRFYFERGQPAQPFP